jgi:hypothetical protein
MSAGLPGLGLGGIFFILSALIAPFVEAVRMLRGRSNPARRRQIARQFLLAVAMVVAIDLTLRGLLAVGGLIGAGPEGDPGLVVLPLAPVGITTGLLALVLAGAKLADLLTRTARPSRPPAARAPARRARRGDPAAPLSRGTRAPSPS